MRGRTLALVAAGVVAASAARAEAPATLPLVWSAPIEPDAGWKLGFGAALSVHADGTALVAIPQEKQEGTESRYRVLALAVAPDGKQLVRSSPGAESKEFGGPVSAVASADGFALTTMPGPQRVALHRLAREGGVRESRELRFPRTPLGDISGIAADGRGNLIVFGGVDEGPHAPGMAGVDRAGRIVWYFAGTQPMPPGGVRAARFRRDGGNDAVVIDREKPFWERRSAQGALQRRAPLPRHWDCWSFLDDRSLATAFYNWEEQAALKVPAKRWVLALIAPGGHYRPRPVVLDFPADQNAYCRMAVNEAGWIVVALNVPRIALFDAELKRRADFDLTPHGVTEPEAVAVDARGGVTVLADTRPTNEAARKLVLLRFAPAVR